MAVTEVTGGTQSATLDTEHTLATSTTGKTYVLVVELLNMANGDITILRLKTKARSGGTSRIAYQRTYAHAQQELNVYSVPVPANIEIVATLEQTDGTGRDYIWALLSID